MTMELGYLIIRGIITVGVVISFLIRNEHRITKLEVEHNNLKDSHDTLTSHGTIPHGG
jgi:hypothetical protein